MKPLTNARDSNMAAIFAIDAINLSETEPCNFLRCSCVQPSRRLTECASAPEVISQTQNRKPPVQPGLKHCGCATLDEMAKERKVPTFCLHC